MCIYIYIYVYLLKVAPSSYKRDESRPRILSVEDWVAADALGERLEVEIYIPLSNDAVRTRYLKVVGEGFVFLFPHGNIVYAHC